MNDREEIRTRSLEMALALKSYPRVVDLIEAADKIEHYIRAGCPEPIPVAAE